MVRIVTVGGADSDRFVRPILCDGTAKDGHRARSYGRLIQGCHSDVSSRQSPVPNGRCSMGSRDSSAANSIPRGTTRISSFGTSGPAPAKSSHPSSSQRAASVIRSSRNAARFVTAVDVGGTEKDHGLYSHCQTGFSQGSMVCLGRECQLSSEFHPE